MKHCGKGLVTALCTLLACPPGLAAHYTLGVSRVGSVGADGERAFQRLEKRVARWIENEPSLGLRVQELGALEKTLSRIESDTRAIENQLRADTLNEKELERLLGSVEGIQELAPLLQRARLAQAFAAWRLGQTERVRHFAARARELSPDGGLADSALPDRPGASRDGFLKFVSEIGGAPTLGCLVELDVFPSHATIRVDGFDWGARRRFELVQGRVFRAWVRAEGYAPRPWTLDCRRAGQWIEAIRLERGGEFDDRVLSRLGYLAESSGSGSLLLAKPLSQDSFGLYLFTPGAGIEAVPTEKPLTFANLMESATDERMPMATDALANLVAQHRSLPLKVNLGQQQGETGYNVAVNRLEAEPPTPWFRRSGFWWVLGAVGVGVATAVLVGSSGRSVQGSSNMAQVD